MTDLTNSKLYKKCLGCLMGGVIGDAIGAFTEGLAPHEIKAQFGWVNDFDSGGTDDTILRDILASTLIKTSGYATIDDWATGWLENFDIIFGPKQTKFFISVLHTARKLKIQGNPRTASLGSVPCSSSAMCIAPVGLVNACNPAQAVAQATHLASLINVQESGFCQDGAAAIAAAVASACRDNASVNSILDDSTKYLSVNSGARMANAINQALDWTEKYKDYLSFRQHAYNCSKGFFQLAKNNSLETVPLTLALFKIAKGNLEKSVTYAANFGRDTDTMAAMVGAIAGTLGSDDTIKPEWKEKVRANADHDQETMALGLSQAAINKVYTEQAAGDRLKQLL